MKKASWRRQHLKTNKMIYAWLFYGLELELWQIVWYAAGREDCRADLN